MKELPMLLSPYDRSIFKRHDCGIYVSEKYDGWRMYYTDGKFYTRRGNEIKLPKKFYRALAEFEDYEFDGELWLGYDTTSSDISAEADFATAQYMIFDIPNIAAPYKRRLRALQRLGIESDCIHVVEQTLCETRREMEEIYDAVIERGGEGVVLRPATQDYYHGVRDTDFMKKKPADRLEAIVVGYHNTVKGAEKQKGYVSSLIVRTVIDNLEFRLSYKDVDAPAVGSVVTVQYSQKTSTGLPKFPVLIGVRDKLDMPEEAVAAVKKYKKRQQVATAEKYKTEVSEWELSHKLCDGITTEKKCCKYGPLELNPGHHIYFDTQKGRIYKLVCDRAGKSVYCTCDAWKYQILPPVFRTCKHCIAVYDYQPRVPYEVRTASRLKHAANKNSGM